MGENLLAELAAIDEQTKQNKEVLDSRRNNFNELKKKIQTIEEDEVKAKQAVEEALKNRNQLDE